MIAHRWQDLERATPDPDPTTDRFVLFFGYFIKSTRAEACALYKSQRVVLDARTFLLCDGLAAFLAGLGIDVEAFHASVVREWVALAESAGVEV